MTLALSIPERGADTIAMLIREALDRVFTVKLPRTAHSRVIGEPVISVIQRPMKQTFFVTVQFEMEHRQI